MNNPDSIYTNHLEHLSQDQVTGYRQGKMSDVEMHRVELHLLECDLCSDALEGLELLSSNQSESALQQLREKLNAGRAPEKDDVTPLYWKWGIAASVLLVATTIFFLLNDSFSPQEQSGEIVQRDPEAGRDSLQTPYLSFREEEKKVEKSVKKPAIKSPKAKKAQQEEAVSVTEDHGRQEIASPPPQELKETEKPRATRSAPLKEQPHEEENLVMEEILTEEPVQNQRPRDTMTSPTYRLQSPDARPAAGKMAKAPADAENIIAHKKVSESKTLTGKITDSSGEPLPGVSVLLAGSRKGAVTNMAGEYSLRLPVADTAVQISSIGYKPAKLFVADTITQLLAVLDEDMEELSEVVVMSYSREQGEDFTERDIMPPGPAGGIRSFKKYLKQNQRYTSGARKARVEGVVVLEFYVEEDSSLSDFQVRKSLGYGLDKEAIRLIKEGPAWKPATLGDDVIRHKARVRVRFKLD